MNVFKALKRLFSRKRKSNKQKLYERIELQVKLSKQIKRFPITTKITYDTDSIVSFKFGGRDPVQLVLVSINPEVIMHVIYANFTAFQRMVYKDKYLADACVVYVMTFLNNFFNSEYRDSLIEMIYTLASNPVYNHINDEVRISKEKDTLLLINKLLYDDIYGKQFTGKDFEFLHEIEERDLTRIFKIFAEVIYNNFRDEITIPRITPELMSMVEDSKFI